MSHHITSNLQNLATRQDYIRSIEVLIGDDDAIPITHIWTSSVFTPSQSFSMQNILCATSIKNNHIAISKFSTQNKTSIEVLSAYFVFKALNTRGQNRKDLYEWSTSDFSWISSIFSYLLTTTKPSLFLWHRRLGHSDLCRLNYIVYSHHISFFDLENLYFVILVIAIKTTNLLLFKYY